MIESETNRGFKRIDFKDFNGEECSIQESSLATEPMIWLGCERETIHHVTGKSCGARMHLTIEMANDLINILTHFVETGEL